MEIDKEDIFVLESFAKTFNEKTPECPNLADIKWDVARDLVRKSNLNLENTDKKKFNAEVLKAYVRIKLRLNKYCQLGFFNKLKNPNFKRINNGESEFYYTMDLDLIKFGYCKFSDGYQKSLIIRLTKEFL